MAATESSEGDTPPRRVGAQPRARAGRGQEKRSPDALGRLGGWVAVGSARGWASPAWLLPPSLLEARGGGLHAGKSAVSRWPRPVPGLAPSHPRPFPGCGWRAGAGPDPLRDPRRGASRDPERGHAGEGWTQLPRGVAGGRACVLLSAWRHRERGPREAPAARLATARWSLGLGAAFPGRRGRARAACACCCVWRCPHPRSLGPGSGSRDAGVGQPSAGREQRAGVQGVWV